MVSGEVSSVLSGVRVMAVLVVVIVSGATCASEPGPSTEEAEVSETGVDVALVLGASVALALEVVLATALSARRA